MPAPGPLAFAVSGQVHWSRPAIHPASRPPTPSVARRGWRANKKPPTKLPGFSPAEAARELSVSESGIYRLLRAGRIRKVKIDYRTVIPASEINRLLEADEVCGSEL